MKNGVLLFVGLLTITAVALSIFSQLKTDETVGKNKDGNKLNVLGKSSIKDPTDTPMPTPKINAPKMEIDVSKSYTAVMKTDQGDITLELNAKKTPVTVNNFVNLSKKGFYNNTIFHRVIKGFMIQGGDPEGDGTGGPGYRFDDEAFDGEYDRGVIAMANAGPNTNGSQFFIVHVDSKSLPKNYVIFGSVTSGLETVDTIATGEVTTSWSGEKSKPVTPVKILSIEIKEVAAETETPVPQTSEEPTPTIKP